MSVMPRILLARGFGFGDDNGCAGLDSTLDVGGVISKDDSSSFIAKSKSDGLNGLTSWDALKMARARETSCGDRGSSSKELPESDAGAGAGAGVGFFGGRGLMIRSVSSYTCSELITGRPVARFETNDLMPSIIITLIAGRTDSICKPGSAAINTDSISTGT